MSYSSGRILLSSQREGQIREVTGPDGKKRKVRVVAPNMFGAPESQQPVKLQ